MDRNDLLDLLSDLARRPADETEDLRERLADYLIGMERRLQLLDAWVKELKAKG